MILEELAYMDMRIVYDVVMPLLMRTNVVLIGISTLDDPYNFWSKMIDQRYPDGRQVFKTLRYSLVCEDCRRRGQATTCRHKIGDLPYWLSEEQYSKLEQIMNDQYESFLRETKGFQCDPNVRPAFDQMGVRALQDLDRIVSPKQHVSHVFFAVDPAAGGRNSDYAIISAIFSGGNMTVRSLSLSLSLLLHKTAYATFLHHISDSVDKENGARCIRVAIFFRSLVHDDIGASRCIERLA